jgi:hypothetical protein
MRVGVVALLQESNTFLSRPTTLREFRDNLPLSGGAVRQSLAAAHRGAGQSLPNSQRLVARRPKWPPFLDT